MLQFVGVQNSSYKQMNCSVQTYSFWRHNTGCLFIVKAALRVDEWKDCQDPAICIESEILGYVITKSHN